MKPGKSPISGRQITRKEALKGLGNPSEWKKESEAVYAEFRAKPSRALKTLLTKVTDKITKALGSNPKRRIEPVYAKKRKRRRSGKSKMRKLHEGSQ